MQASGAEGAPGDPVASGDDVPGGCDGGCQPVIELQVDVVADLNWVVACCACVGLAGSARACLASGVAVGAQQVGQRGAHAEHQDWEAGHGGGDRPRCPVSVGLGQEVVADLTGHAQRQRSDGGPAGEAAGPRRYRGPGVQPCAQREGGVCLDSDGQRDGRVEVQRVPDAGQRPDLAEAGEPADSDPPGPDRDGGGQGQQEQWPGRDDPAGSGGPGGGQVRTGGDPGASASPIRCGWPCERWRRYELGGFAWLASAWVLWPGCLLVLSWLPSSSDYRLPHGGGRCRVVSGRQVWSGRAGSPSTGVALVTRACCSRRRADSGAGRKACADCAAGLAGRAPHGSEIPGSIGVGAGLAEAAREKSQLQFQLQFTWVRQGPGEYVPAAQDAPERW